MADRQIRFTAPEIRALLDGRKTQTRLVLKPQPIVEPNGAWRWEGRNGGFVGAMGTHVDEGFPESAKAWCCYQPGDRLWARETWGVGTQPCPYTGWRDGIEYRADGVDDDAPPLYDIIPDGVDADSIRSGWRPSIQMPRWASRLTLIVTDVRVQRVQDISEADAIAEGVWPGEQPPTVIGRVYSPTMPVHLFGALWDHLNASRGYGWDANPWVCAVSFQVHRCNIDAMEPTNANP